MSEQLIQIQLDILEKAIEEKQERLDEIDVEMWDMLLEKTKIKSDLITLCRKHEEIRK